MKRLSALVHGQTFTIPPDMVARENLSSNEVSIGPLKDLVHFQEGMALKISPYVRKTLQPSHFNKMKVGPALNVFSKATSAGLNTWWSKNNDPPLTGQQHGSWSRWHHVLLPPSNGTEQAQDGGVPKGHQVPPGHDPTVPWAEDFTTV